MSMSVLDAIKWLSLSAESNLLNKGDASFQTDSSDRALVAGLKKVANNGSK